jgi:hypothetical protein
VSLFVTLTATQSVIVVEPRLPPIDDHDTTPETAPEASEDDLG